MQTGLTAVNHWSFFQRFGFRFFAAYFFIYIFPFPIGALPFTESIGTHYTKLWDSLVPWIGEAVLHLSTPITIMPNGSGDTTYNYVQVLAYATIALLAALIWTLADRRCKQYDLLLYWLMVYVRYYLAFTLMSYGFVKIIQLQFPFPSLYSLMEPYGQSSPMGLAWNFMGYSRAFNFFTGLAEAAGGFLLLFRRTTTFGALIITTVLSNIVMMNFCYDIPVKLFSSHLLLMNLFILMPDLRRLIHFFFLNRPVPGQKLKPVFYKRWMRWTWISVKALLIVSAFYANISGTMEGYKLYGAGAPKAPLYGIYHVETFVKGRDTLPPLTTDTVRWRSLIVSWLGFAHVKQINDSVKRYNFTPDTTVKTITLFPAKEESQKSSLRYVMPDTAHLVLWGRLNKDSVYMRLKKFDRNQFLLVNRGFHWINEYPFNR